MDSIALEHRQGMGLALSLEKSWQVMAFTVQDFHDLVALLTQHPEWRAEIRRLVLTEELLALPQIVRDLAEAQQRTEQQVAQLTQQVAQLTQQVAQIVEAQRRTERQIVRLQDDVGELKGIVHEQRYRNRAFAYFSRLVRHMHTVTDDELVALLEEAVARGVPSEDGMDEIGRADVVVRGQRREAQSPDEVYLVVEVSWGVGPRDVERRGQARCPPGPNGSANHARGRRGAHHGRSRGTGTGHAGMAGVGWTCDRSHCQWSLTATRCSNHLRKCRRPDR